MQQFRQNVHSVLSEIWKFKGDQFVSQVASTQNHLAFISRVINVAVD